MKKDTLHNPNISFVEKFVDGNHDGYCYCVSGSVSRTRLGRSRMNILCIAYPDFTPIIGKILDGLERFGGSYVFEQNYGAHYFMPSGQVDLIVGYDLEAGEADWLGKCYDSARKSGAPLCADFIVGKDCTAEDFREKFKLFMQNDYFALRNRLEAEPSTERVRKLTDKEIGWRGKKFLCRLDLSRAAKSYLTSLGILDPELPLKGSVRDLVYNFIMMVGDKPTFTGEEGEKSSGEIRFILEQLGYLPRTKIDRGELRITPNQFIDDETAISVLESSAEAHNRSDKFFLRGGYVEMVERADPKHNSSDTTSIDTFNVESLQQLLSGEIDPYEWFSDGSSYKFYKNSHERSLERVLKSPFIKDSVVNYWSKSSDKRTTAIDRNLLNLLVSIEEALCIPHFAYETVHGKMYGKDSLIPMQKVA